MATYSLDQLVSQLKEHFTNQELRFGIAPGLIFNKPCFPTLVVHTYKLDDRPILEQFIQLVEDDLRLQPKSYGLFFYAYVPEVNMMRYARAVMV